MSRSRGFSLVELMVVVVIIGVLAAIAGTSYKKYADKARAAEVYAMFAEIRSKEEAYRAEFSSYCNTAATCATPAVEDTVFPVLLSTGEPNAKSVTSGQPVGWTTMGINPGKSTLYCGYVAVAGTAAQWSNAGTRGVQIFNSTAPTGAWWYMSAICDNDGNHTKDSTYTSGMNTTAVAVLYEGY